MSPGPGDYIKRNLGKIYWLDGVRASRFICLKQLVRFNLHKSHNRTAKYTPSPYLLSLGTFLV